MPNRSLPLLPLLLLLLPLVSPGSAANSVDCGAVRRVLAAAMGCQRISQLHAVLLLHGQQLCSFRLRLHPDNGSVVEVADRKLTLPLASLSKGMFCSALPAIQRRLRLSNASFDLYNTPVQQWLGRDFWFVDHDRTQRVTLQDLVSHTTGLSRADAILTMGTAGSKAQAARQAGRLLAPGSFRASFIYNNLAYVIADLAVERLTSKKFPAYMREFLWQPLGMDDTRGGSESSLRTLEEGSMGVYEAAGGILSTLDDVVKYMQHHMRNNYSSSAQQPVPFAAANAAWINWNSAFNRQFYRPDVSDLPDIDYQSYGYGWARDWYRDNLVLEHSGTIFNYRAQIDIFPKRKLGMFTHTQLGANGSIFQELYAKILNKYMADLVIQGRSFVTEDNVCRLFVDVPTQLVHLPRRRLTQAEEQLVIGSFGHYGLGTLKLQKDNAGRLTGSYGFSVVELLPISRYRDASVLEFVLRILQPESSVGQSPVVGLNASHVTIAGLPGSESQPPGFYLTVWREGERTLANSPVLDARMRLQKGLEPGSWKRPELCPPPPEPKSGHRPAPAAAFASLPLPLLLLLLLLPLLLR